MQELRRQYDFVLIGGWAVYLYAKGLKSRDIDFICGYEELEKLRRAYDMVKNDRLKKYEIHAGDFDIDIYVPFFSNLGLPVEDIEKMTEVREGFKVLNPEALLILKQRAYQDRAGSIKGEKDKYDIIALLPHVDVGKYLKLLQKYHLAEYKNSLKRLLKETREAVEIGFNAHAFAKLKKKFLK